MIIFGIVIIILGIIFPLLINCISITLFINTPATLIVLGTVSIFYSYCSLDYKKNNLIKAIINDNIYIGSLWGMLVGVVIGFIMFIYGLPSLSAMVPGLILLEISLLYSAIVAQISKILKSSIELKNIEIESYEINVLAILRIVIAIVFVFLALYMNRLDFEGIFKFEDLVSFILIFIGMLIASRKYKLIFEVKSNNFNKYYNELIVASFHIGIIVSTIRIYLSLLEFNSFNYIFELIAISLFPFIYSVTVGIMIIMPMKYKVDN